MNNNPTTIKCIMKAIEEKMAIFTEVELHHKNSDKSKIIQSDIFVNELKSLSNLNLFNNTIDFEYELICNDNQIDNEQIKILCGYKNYIFPFYINAILRLNKNVCKSIDLLLCTLTNNIY